MSTAQQNQITEEAPEGAESEAEFDQAFDELAAEREGSPSTDADPDDKAPSTPQGKNEAEPGSTEPRSGEGAAAKAPASGNDDVFANAPEEVRSAVEALRNDYEHRLRSTSGRLSAADRELARLRQQQSGGGQEQERKPLKSLLEDDRLKTIGEEYPDLKPLLETLTSVAERVDHVGTTVETAQSSAAESAEEQALTERVPNWVDLARHEQFQSWKDQQPRHVREALARNWDAIVDAEEAADIFERFATSQGIELKGGAAPGEGEGGKPTPSRRERQQQGSRAAHINGPAAQAGEPEEFDAAFEAEVARRERQRSRRA